MIHLREWFSSVASRIVAAIISDEPMPKSQIIGIMIGILSIVATIVIGYIGYRESDGGNSRKLEQEPVPTVMLIEAESFRPVDFYDGRVRISGYGTLQEDTYVRVEKYNYEDGPPIVRSDLKPIGANYFVEIIGRELEKTEFLFITFAFDVENLPDSICDPSRLKIIHFYESVWVGDDPQHVACDSQTIFVQTTRFSPFVLVHVESETGLESSINKPSSTTIFGLEPKNKPLIQVQFCRIDPRNLVQLNTYYIRMCIDSLLR